MYWLIALFYFGSRVIRNLLRECSGIYIFIFFISLGKNVHVSFLTLSVIEVKQQRGGIKEKLSLWPQLAPGGPMGVRKTDIYFCAWKYKKRHEKCLWIVSRFALQKEMQITTALSVLPLGSQNLFWFEAFFNLYNCHKNNTPKSPTVFFQWNFQSFLFCLSWLLIFSFVSCFVLYFPYLPAESRHPINIQCENHVSVCMLCTCCSKKNKFVNNLANIHPWKHHI